MARGKSRILLAMLSILLDINSMSPFSLLTSVVIRTSMPDILLSSASSPVSEMTSMTASVRGRLAGLAGAGCVKDPDYSIGVYGRAIASGGVGMPKLKPALATAS